MAERYCIISTVEIPKRLRENKVLAEAYAAGYIFGRDGKEDLMQNERLKPYFYQKAGQPKEWQDKILFRDIQNAFWSGNRKGYNVTRPLSYTKDELRQTQRERHREEVEGLREPRPKFSRNEATDLCTLMERAKRNPREISRECWAQAVELWEKE